MWPFKFENNNVKLIDRLLSIRNQVVRELVFSILVRMRAVCLRIIRKVGDILLCGKTAPSTDYYANVALVSEIKSRYQNANDIREIDPFYFVEISHFNFVLQNYEYDMCIEIGSYRGELISTLARINPSIKFIGFDVNHSITDLNAIYEMDNLKFLHQKMATPDLGGIEGRKTLLIGKGVFMFYSEKELRNLFLAMKKNKCDIALAEPTKYQFNHTSRPLSKNFNTGHISYSHNYSLLLKICGYDILYDSNILNLGYYFPREYKPYFLTLMCASLQHSNNFMSLMNNRLEGLGKHA